MPSYYPPDTAPQRGPHCGHETANEFERRWYSATCLLAPGHDGDHNYSANWNAHVDANPERDGVTIAFRSWHDSRGMRVRSREDADKLLGFLTAVLDEAFPKADP